MAHEASCEGRGVSGVSGVSGRVGGWEELRSRAECRVLSEELAAKVETESDMGGEK